MALSSKQLEILKFPYDEKYNALICDGSVRSGKTINMIMSFVLWGMDSFNNCNFAICSKSVGAAERNILKPLQSISYFQKNYKMKYNRGEHALTVSRGRKKNTFYLFGGRDESSYTLIQGLTLAGVMLDEVALMPRSFVEQALTRCSVEGAKMFFSCNPSSPAHWFYQEWVKNPAPEKKVKRLRFQLDDNPSLSEETKKKYHAMYSGVFYKRYILGEWVIAEGAIYDMFDHKAHIYAEPPVDLRWTGQRTIAVDYGTTNPCVFLDILDYNGIVCVDNEYRWDSRTEQRQKTDAEYADDMIKFIGDAPCSIIIDPSAASFIAELRSRGLFVIPAENAVIDGIRRTSSLLHRKQLAINKRCSGLIDEMTSYSWDDKAAMRGEEKPIKTADHAPDALRYFINSLPDWRFEE